MEIIKNKLIFIDRDGYNVSFNKIGIIMKMEKNRVEQDEKEIKNPNKVTYTKKDIWILF